jgi:hypothetical protein
LSAAPSPLDAAFEHAADEVPLGEEVEAEQQLAAMTVPATMTLVVT